jgi:ankyrin repeat protein
MLPAQVPAKVDFATDVKPILQENCVSCHGPEKQKAGMRLDRKSSAMKAFSRRIVPGSSENSFLYHRINGEFGQQMPPDGALKQDQIAVIKAWIDQGAEWPDALSNEVDAGPPNAKAVAMVEMLRNGDLKNFMKAVDADPALLNARGPEGSTPFMYSVLYTNATVMEKLLKKGADPNKHNDVNATALLWTAGDLEKTRVLVAHGADVNAKSDDLRTPLMIASRHYGSVEAVRLLLDHGANVNPGLKPETESSPLLEAVTAGDPAITELLMQHGADARGAGEAGLFMSVQTGCDRCLDLLVPKVTSKEVYTAALEDIAPWGDMRAIHIMLDHGADVKAFDPLGRTALMYAVVSDMLPVDEVKLLIERGADVNAKDKHMDSGDGGETVLDMAKKNGDTPVVALLEKAGAKSTLMTEVDWKPRVNNEIRSAVQDSLPLLQRTDVNFASKSGCVSCHNNSMTAMTVGLARTRGFQVDEKIAAAQVKVNADALKNLRDRMHQGFVLAVGDNFSENIVGYMLLGLKAENYKADLNTDAAAMDILFRQRPDGSWPLQKADTRPPLCLGYVGNTAVAMRALQLYAPKTDAATYRKAVERAGAWMATVQSYSNDDRGWRVAGLAWAGTNKAATQKAMQELLATQRPDGSWSDMPLMASTAYATGKSLVALQIGGLPVTDAAYQRGIKWLLANQQQDGTWYVKSRALGFQPYFDAGFPHDHDQWISSAATNWADMALTLALPTAKDLRASRGE